MQANRNQGAPEAAVPQIFPKIDILPIENDTKKKKNKKLQAVSNSSKSLTTGTITLDHFM